MIMEEERSIKITIMGVAPTTIIKIITVVVVVTTITTVEKAMETMEVALALIIINIRTQGQADINNLIGTNIEKLKLFV